MKKFLFLISALLLTVSCTTNKTAVSATEPVPTVESAPETRTIKGEVIEIKRGKDGYTATMTSTTNEIYFVTISRINLTKPEQYKTVKAGDKIKVTGDFWSAEDGNHITAREIQ